MDAPSSHFDHFLLPQYKMLIESVYVSLKTCIRSVFSLLLFCIVSEAILDPEMLKRKALPKPCCQLHTFLIVHSYFECVVALTKQGSREHQDLM